MATCMKCGKTIPPKDIKGLTTCGECEDKEQEQLRKMHPTTIVDAIRENLQKEIGEGLTAEQFDKLLKEELEKEWDKLRDKRDNLRDRMDEIDFDIVDIETALGR